MWLPLSLLIWGRLDGYSFVVVRVPREMRDLSAQKTIVMSWPSIQNKNSSRISLGPKSGTNACRCWLAPSAGCPLVVIASIRWSRLAGVCPLVPEAWCGTIEYVTALASTVTRPRQRPKKPHNSSSL